MRNKFFTLEIANGQKWQICPTKEAIPWLFRLSKIVKFSRKTKKNIPKIFVTYEDKGKKAFCAKIQSLKSLLGDRLPSDGWRHYGPKAIRFWHNAKSQDIICELSRARGHEIEIVKMMLFFQAILKFSIEKGAIPIHAGLIKKAGKGFLLAAAGSTGKTTCCKRLPKRWEALSDDEALIVKDKKGIYVAHPLPTWSDNLSRHPCKPLNIQRSIPLAGIFFLEQARKDRVKPVGRGRAACFINQLSSQICNQIWTHINPNDGIFVKNRIFNNACCLVKHAPIFTLQVSMSGKFWEKIEGAIRNV